MASSRNGDSRSRRGNEPSSSPSTKTTSKRRVRARGEVEHGHAARLAGARACDGRVVERRDDRLRGSPRRRGGASRRARPGDGARPRRRGGRGASPPLATGSSGGWAAAVIRCASSRTAATGSGSERSASTSAQRARPELLDLLGDPLGLADRAAPQAALGEVDLMARQPGERRAQEREQRGPVGAQPREAEQRAERGAVGGAREPGRGPRARRGRRRSRTPSRAARA